MLIHQEKPDAVGWNTSVGSLPKKHTLTYIAKALELAQRRAIICLDLAFPKVFQGKSVSLVVQHADVYETVARLLAREYQKEIQVVRSDLGDELFPWLELARSISIQGLLRSLPPSIDKKSISIKDLSHPLFEYQAWKLLAESGAEQIITNVSRPSLVDGYPLKISAKPLDARSSESDKVDELWNLLSLGGFVKGYYDKDRPFSVTDSNTLTICNSVREYLLAKCGNNPFALILTGSASQAVENPNDIDLLVISESIQCPTGFDPVADEVCLMYARGDLDTVALKSDINGKCVSLRFLHPKTIQSYYSKEVLRQWRQRPQAKSASEYFDIFGNLVLMPICEETMAGGYVRSKQTMIKGIPILETNLTMLEKGYFIYDSGGFTLAPFLLLQNLANIRPGYAQSAADVLLGLRKPLQLTVKKRIIAQASIAESKVRWNSD